MIAFIVLTATVAALSLGPSFAHVLEASPRILVWSPELWREATVFNGQFRLFAPVGAVLDIAAIACPAILAFLIRGDKPGSTFAFAAAVLYGAALVTWFAWVRPANDMLGTWGPGPIPADFDEVRLRWETGHMAVAALKLGGFVSVALSMVSAGRGTAG